MPEPPRPMSDSTHTHKNGYEPPKRAATESSAPEPGSPIRRLHEIQRQTRLVVEACRRHGGANATLAASQGEEMLEHAGNLRYFLEHSELDETVDPGPESLDPPEVQ